MSKDSLLVRVMCVNAGICMLGLAAWVSHSGMTAVAPDSAIYVVAVLLAAVGGFSIYAGFCFRNLNRSDAVWLVDVWWLCIAMVLLALPVTLLIRLFQRQYSSKQ